MRYDFSAEPTIKLTGFCRSEFEAEQLRATEDRLANLESTVTTEDTNLRSYETKKREIQDELAQEEAAIAEQQEELKALQEDLDEKSKAVDQAKRQSSNAAKALDQVLKDVASKVRMSLPPLYQTHRVTRTMRSRSLASNAPHCTESVGLKRSACRLLEAIFGMCPWKRYLPRILY